MGDSSDDFFSSFESNVPRRPGGPPPGPPPSASATSSSAGNTMSIRQVKKTPPPPPPPGARKTTPTGTSNSTGISPAIGSGSSSTTSATVTSLRKPAVGGPPQKQQHSMESSSSSYYGQNGGGSSGVSGTVPAPMMTQTTRIPSTIAPSGIQQQQHQSVRNKNDFLGSDWYSPTQAVPVVDHLQQHQPAVLHQHQQQTPSAIPSYGGYGGSYAATSQQYSQSAPTSSTVGVFVGGGMDSVIPPVSINTNYFPQPSIMNPYAATSNVMDVDIDNVSAKYSLNNNTNNMVMSSGGGGYNDLDDLSNEPPLLEELGINVEHIVMKTKAIVIPFRRFSKNSALMDPNIIVEDADLAGPLAFALLLGGELMLAGKLQFEYIYGFGMFGCLSMTLILNLMTPGNTAVSFWTVTSILGYALLPVNVLAAVKIVVLNLAGFLTLTKILAVLTVIWSTFASTRLLEVGCGMEAQRYLLAYPIALLYSAFVLITIF